jgi:putative ABC transport system permease protein
MSPFLAILLGVFFAVYLALAVMVLRRPLLGRLAFREALRRPGQTAILIIGLMIAGASIFSVQVFVDSTDQAVLGLTLAGWGRDDVELTAAGAPFDSGLAAQLAADPAVAADAASIQNAIVLSTSVADLDRNLGKPGVQLIGLEMSKQQRFGSFVLSDGRHTDGSELTTGRVFITQSLAGALGAHTGDRLQVTGPGSGAGSAELVVAGIIQRTEAGAYGADRSIFASLATAQGVTGTSDVNLVRISARGDGESETARASRMINGLKALTSGAGVIVLETKRTAIEAEKSSAGGTRAAFTFLALIVALAASAMVVNLAVMLAEERRPRLAVLRALGLTRTGLVKLAVIEGAIYSLGGAIAGLPLGFAVALVLNSILQPALTGSNTGLQLAVQPTSLLGAIAGASLITLTTLFITSLRTSGMAISSAIRDLPEPAKTRGRSWVRLALLAGGALAGAAVAIGAAPQLRALGGAVAIACAGGLLRGRLADRARFTLIGAAIAVWAVGFTSIEAASWGTDNQVPASIMGVAVTVAGLSVLLASNLRILEAITRVPGRVASDLRATLRPAVAYTSRRPLRSGLVIAAFGLIIAIITSLSASVTAGLPDYARGSGGFDVRVAEVGSSQLTLPADVQRNIVRQETLPSRTFFGPVKWSSSGLGVNSDYQQQAMNVFALTDAQMAAGIVPLISWDPKYHSAAEAWKAIAGDPGLVAGPYLSGAEATLATAQGALHLTVIALQGNLSSAPSIVDGMVGSQRLLDRLAGSTPGVVLLLKAAPGVTPRSLADQVQRATYSAGADATTTRQLIDDGYASGKGFLDLLLTLMRVGLLVGVFSLGTIALRAVVERRRAIGVLRAIGFRPGQVLTGILLETVLIATAGVAVGLVAAFSIGSSSIVGGQIYARFIPDGWTLFSAIGLVYAGVLLVTLLPAIRAARLRPAEALRVVG